MVDPLDPDAISSPTKGLNKIDATVGNTDPKKAPGADFKQVLNKTGYTPQAATTRAQGPTPASLAGSGRNVMAPGQANATTVANAMTQANNTSKQVQAKLQQNGSQLTNAQQLQLKQKLTNATNNIQQAAAKVGVNPDQFQAKNPGGPFGSLLGMLSEGQQMLRSAKEQVPIMSKTGHLNPGDFFAMQLKLSVAQLDLEFSSQMLGKSSDALNKLMNINI